MYIRAHKTHTNITLGYPTVHTHRPLLMCPIKRKRVAKGLGNRRHCEAAERITTATGASLVSLSLFLSLTISVSIEGSPASHHYELEKMIHPPLLVAKLSSSFNGVGENKLLRASTHGRPLLYISSMVHRGLEGKPGPMLGSPRAKPWSSQRRFQPIGCKPALIHLFGYRAATAIRFTWPAIAPLPNRV